MASVSFNCLVEFMFGMNDSALTSGLVFRPKAGCGGAKQKHCDSG
jgi:hypothetical protein